MEETIKNEKDQTLVHDFNNSNSKIAFSPKIGLIFIIVILMGLGSGYLLSTKSSVTSKISKTGTNSTSASTSKGTVVGSNDTETFKDTAEGVLKQGGIEGEGEFHIERPGGISQNVYLTSSSVDLSKFIDMKIKIWGQTQKAQHAGWLMDVGRIEVL